MGLSSEADFEQSLSLLFKLRTLIMTDTRSLIRAHVRTCMKDMYGRASADLEHLARTKQAHQTAASLTGSLVLFLFLLRLLHIKQLIL